MAVPKQILSSVGLWQGSYKLNQSWLPEGKRVSESFSQLHIDLDQRHSFATITYRWTYKDKPQDGVIILCGDEKSQAYEVGWVDSWHESSAVLHLSGRISPSGIKTTGSYHAGDQTWGWTADLSFENDELHLEMDNVPPKGEPIWAVRATYKRA